MRSTPQPEFFENLTVTPLDTSFAVGRILRGGLHAYLLEAVNEFPESDVFSVSMPTPRHQTLFISSSLEAYRQFHDPSNSIDRHPALSGAGTAASSVFGGEEGGRPGMLLAKASADLKVARKQLRDSLRPNESRPELVEGIAECIFESVDFKSRAGTGAYQACQEAMVETLPKIMFGTEVNDPALLHELGLELAAISGLLRSVPLVRRAIGRLARSSADNITERISPVISNPDLVTSVAGIYTLANALYWGLWYRGQHPDASIQGVVTETLRHHAAPSVTMPRASLEDKDPTAVFLPSPYAAMVHPATFVEERYRGDKATYEAILTTSIVFGRVDHVCPANSATRPILESILELAEERSLRLEPLVIPKLNPMHLVRKTPTKNTQGHFLGDV